MLADLNNSTLDNKVNNISLKRTQTLSLRENFSWALIGNMTYAGCQWIMLMVLAKIGNPILVGRFALGFALTSPIFMLTNLQLRGIQATDAKREYCFTDYLNLRLITTIIAVLIIFGIAFLGKYGRETAIVVVIIGLAKGFESISDVIYGFLQQQERMDRIAVSMIIKGVISLAALTIGVYVTGSIIWGVIGLGLVWALVLFVYDVKSQRYISKCLSESEIYHLSWNYKILLKLAWLSIPLGIVMFRLTQYQYSPIFYRALFRRTSAWYICSNGIFNGGW
jgi:O-antigen/teichoic acid export membrane protein